MKGVRHERRESVAATYLLLLGVSSSLSILGGWKEREGKGEDGKRRYQKE